MTIKPQHKSNLITLVLKITEYGAILVAFFTLGEPALEDYVDNRIENRHIEERIEEENKVSFRKLLSEETGIKEDRIHIVFGKMYSLINKFKSDIDTFEIKYMPMLDQEMREIRVGVYVHPDGTVWYHHQDGQQYRVVIGEDGRRYWHNGTEWVLVNY